MQKIELQLPICEKDITQTLTLSNMSSWSGIILLNTALDEVEGKASIYMVGLRHLPRLAMELKKKTCKS